MELPETVHQPHDDYPAVELVNHLVRSLFKLIGSSPALNKFHAELHKCLDELIPAPYLAVAFAGEYHPRAPSLVYQGDENVFPTKALSVQLELIHHVFHTGKSLLIDNDRFSQLLSVGAVSTRENPFASWLGIPLITRDKTIGVLALHRGNDHPEYAKEDEQLLRSVSPYIAQAVEYVHRLDTLNKTNQQLEQKTAQYESDLTDIQLELQLQIDDRERIERQLKHATLHDALTGLPNRNFLLGRLSGALMTYVQDPRYLFAVLFLDLDRFKVINDSVGHLVGDELLTHVGNRISRCLQPGDLVARLGGDEFAVVLHDIQNGDDACQFAQRLLDVLSTPLRIGGKEVFTSASIGIALVAPRYAKAEELLRDADVAMYRAKAQGRQRYWLFDERLHQEALRLLELESDLRRAITRQEFEPYFQPIVQLENASIVGFEALLRWNHPERGVLAPGQFLDVAEENGLSEQIDWLMFERVCALTSALVGDNGFISVNLSGHHFRSDQLVDDFLAMLKKHRVPTSSIRVEITEHVLLENPPAVKEMMESLRQHGISISLDDFGTGYSSLSYLHQYPIQTLKVDRSFVSELKPGEISGSYVVVRAIHALADSLSMQVIPEGVETENQRAALLEIGCEFGQGYLFSKPLPAAHWLSLSSQHVHRPTALSQQA